MVFTDSCAEPTAPTVSRHEPDGEPTELPSDLIRTELDFTTGRDATFSRCILAGAVILFEVSFRLRFARVVLRLVGITSGIEDQECDNSEVRLPPPVLISCRTAHGARTHRTAISHPRTWSEVVRVLSSADVL